MMVGCWQTEWVSACCIRNRPDTDVEPFFTASDPKVWTVCQVNADRIGRVPTYREFEWLASRGVRQGQRAAEFN